MRMNESEWHNAIWNMLANGNIAEEIKESVSLIDFDSFIDEVESEFLEETEDD